MKKIVALVIAITLMLSAIPALAAWAPIGITTGGTAGTYYPLGGEIAALWMKHIEGLDVSVQSSGGSKDNIIKINNEEAEVGTVQNDVMLTCPPILVPVRELVEI